jgi:hypothetical protein
MIGGRNLSNSRPFVIQLVFQQRVLCERKSRFLCFRCTFYFVLVLVVVLERLSYARRVLAHPVLVRIEPLNQFGTDTSGTGWIYNSGENDQARRSPASRDKGGSVCLAPVDAKRDVSLTFRPPVLISPPNPLATEASRQVAHSIAEPRASSKNLARWRPTVPRAMKRGVDESRGSLIACTRPGSPASTRRIA